MSPIPVDVLIIGGGGAGLWLLDELTRANYEALLIECAALGTGQTVGTQGIIHGGLKYTLGGMLTGSARAIRDMPTLWRQCLAGEREPDLSQTGIRSEACLMWRTASISSQLGMLGARAGLKTRPNKLAADQIPDALAGCPGEVFQVNEQVIDPASLLECMRARLSDRLLLLDRESIEFERGEAGIEAIRLVAKDTDQILRPKIVALTAGAGNGPLRERAGLDPDAMQLRPLHMILARGELPELNGHCVDGAKTRVTITSDTIAGNRRIWQLGGQVAEDGVTMNSVETIAHAKRELEAVLPGVDFSETEWATYRTDRAEARTEDGSRPEGVQVRQDGNVITGWPTKLVLFPLLASEIMSHLDGPAGLESPVRRLRIFPKPSVALPPWENRERWLSSNEID
ncbi:MAG: FAD-dependent oxidoreductase [Planctomycetota bacterium]|nr:FAD-dependent oxidoreductase [Planctomycetota bacterium]